jgi:hypothetical protein
VARDDPRPGRFRHGEPLPPARRTSDVTIQRFDGVYEVDPELMGEHFAQQAMPAWDTRRIVAARHDHLADIHAQFADAVVLAGEESEVGSEPPPRAIPDAQESGS